MKFICPQCGFLSEASEARECPVCHEANIVPASTKEVKLAEAGLFLRDDTEMRKEWDDVKRGETPAEAYSFCHRSDEKYPFQRIQVFAGSKNWAIEEAYKLFEAGRLNLSTRNEIHG